jgi:2,4-dienoyl-CoA reductase-like NADH-dependent reductase (Old Yellow Enzyme family)
MDFTQLFEPVKIGNIVIKNRLAQAPISDVQEEGGLPNEQTIAFLAARAVGGAGLIHVGSVNATKMAFLGHNVMQCKLYNPTHVPRYGELTDTLHAFGAKTFIQLMPGFGAGGKPVNGEPPYSASTVPFIEGCMPKQFEKYFRRIPSDKISEPVIPREMTIEEILREQDEFANSAYLAAMADFDGIEIHLCHGYLPQQFRSPLTNHRKDQYGGSLENRNRFSLELVQKTIERIRPAFPDIPVGVRLSAREFKKGGFSFEETKELSKELANLGITHISVTNGSPETYKHMIPDQDGSNIEYAKGIKEASGLPVMCNNIHDPVKAIKAIEEECTDIINMCRPLIADPELPNKVKEGRIEDIKKCSRCYMCELRIAVGYLPIRCSVNPDVGREKYMKEYQRPSNPSGKRIVPPLMRKR